MLFCSTFIVRLAADLPVRDQSGGGEMPAVGSADQVGSGTTTLNDERLETPHLQVFFASRLPPLRMVEPIVQPTCGPRVGHRISSHQTTVRWVAREVADAAGLRRRSIDLLLAALEACCLRK